jgi:hypothetical protein
MFSSLDITTYRIIRECKRFANKSGDFVDIGASSDLYYNFLAPYFDKVYCIEKDVELLENIDESIEIISFDSIDDCSKNVVFLRISLDDLSLAFKLLKLNNFPPFIFFSSTYFEKNKKYTEEIGYKISYLMDGIYLASSNDLFK